MRGPGYDGTANMTGKLFAVCTRIQTEIPEAHYVQCYAHCLNLAVVKSCQLPIICNTMDAVKDISFAFSSSSKRTCRFKTMLQHAKFVFVLYTVRQKLNTTWLVSIIFVLIMNLFQIGLLFSLPVHTYLLTCKTGYWSIFIYVYMTRRVKCHAYFSTFVFANESWFLLCRVLSFIFYWFGMVLRTLTIPERWQAVGMNNGGFSHRRVAEHFRVNHSIIVRLMQRFRQTGNVTDRPRAGRPRKTTPRGPAHIQTGAATAVQYSWCTSW
jgi:hypothetical protein